jgi:hypothetical protein
MRGERSAATALYLALNLQKTFVVVRIMAPNSYSADAFKGLNRRNSSPESLTSAAKRPLPRNYRQRTTD